MKWADVIAGKSLRDLPYKIELDRDDNILMGSAGDRHGGSQVRIASLLESLLDDEAISECSIDAPEGERSASTLPIGPRPELNH
jgi:hypothetical protein